MTTARDYLAEIAPFVASPKVVLSLGAGVQSSTLAEMCAAGYLPWKIAAGIFADTQAEPPAVYRWIDRLEKRLPFPIHRVTKGNLGVEGLEMRRSRKGLLYWKNAIPFYVRNADGSKGKMNRKCTAEYKIRQIVKKLRAIVGPSNVRTWAKAYGVKRERVGEAWRWRVPEGTPPLAISLIGISLDEIQRVKPSREPWIANRHPLVDAGITRQDCLNWMREQGHPTPPRSACVFCPFHSDAEWLRLKREDPESFAFAAQFEAAAAAAAAACQVTKGVPFLHSSLKPLAQVTFREERTGNLFGEECSGVCGV